MNEYVTEIASGPNTYIMHFDDKNPENDPITEENINLDDEIQEKILESRKDGRMNYYFMP